MAFSDDLQQILFSCIAVLKKNAKSLIFNGCAFKNVFNCLYYSKLKISFNVFQN